MKLDEGDVRGMVRLVGEVAAFPGGHAEKKRFLMEGLCKLVDADAWVWGLSCQRGEGKPRAYVSFIKGGFTEQAFAKFAQALEHPEMSGFGASFAAEVEASQSHLTRLLGQMVDEEAFERSGFYPLWRAADLGSVIFSQRPLGDNAGSVVGLYRRQGRAKFSARESRIAHVVLTEVPWLHELGWPEDRGVKVAVLSKRHRLTLNLLIVGQAHKEIAEHLKISPNTLHGYIKDIYRHFNVHSQTGLMNRFYLGDGRDGS